MKADTGTGTDIDTESESEAEANIDIDTFTSSSSTVIGRSPGGHAASDGPSTGRQGEGVPQS